MKGLKHIALIFSLFCGTLTVAQDMHFTQFYSSPLVLNPALAGADVCSRASLTYRNQWPGIKKTYRSYLLSLDHFFHTKNIGAGFMIANDVAGTGNLRTTIVNGSIAYEAKLTKKLYMRLGAQPAIVVKSLNYDDLLFGDQIARGGSSVATVESPADTKTFFDVGAGGLLYTKTHWVGISAFHLNKPNQSMRGEPTGILPVKFSIHAGGKFEVNPKKEEREEFQRKFISPALNYRHQNKFDQLDIGFYYTQSVFNLGLWYRGIPLFKSYAPGYRNNDAIAIITGVKTPRFNFGYSYDITISRLTMLSRGAHEITISYQLCKVKKKKPYRLLTPCPKF